MNVTRPEKITNNKWLNLFRVEWDDGGQRGDWVFASRKEQPQVGQEPDAVVIVPIHVQTDPVTGRTFRRLAVTREFRVPINDYEYTFPAGLKLIGESVIECAARELREETGLQLTTVKRVSPTVYTSTGLSDESVVMVFAECVGETTGEGREAPEELSVYLLDIEQVASLSSDYRVKHSSKSWPVLYLFSLLGTLELRG